MGIFGTLGNLPLYLLIEEKYTVNDWCIDIKSCFYSTDFTENGSRITPFTMNFWHQIYIIKSEIKRFHLTFNDVVAFPSRLASIHKYDIDILALLSFTRTHTN